MEKERKSGAIRKSRQVSWNGPRERQSGFYGRAGLQMREKIRPNEKEN